MKTRHFLNPALVIGLLALTASGAFAQIFVGYGNPPITANQWNNGYFNTYGYSWNGPPAVAGNFPVILNYGEPPIALTQNGAQPYYGLSDAATIARANMIPRVSDSITAQREANNKVRIQWQGDPRLVSRITFTLLDKNRGELAKKTVFALPAEARFNRATKTAGYQVVVEYINGTTNTVISPL